MTVLGIVWIVPLIFFLCLLFSLRNLSLNFERRFPQDYVELKFFVFDFISNFNGFFIVCIIIYIIFKLRFFSNFYLFIY